VEVFMSHRLIGAIGALAITVGTAPHGTRLVAAQSSTQSATSGTSKAWTLPRTPDGHPDLQGVWEFSTITPLERPRGLGDKATFTAEEAAAFEREENRRLNRDLIDPAKGGAQYPPGGVVPYNEFWYDRGQSVVGSRRTSLVIEPPDGRLPPMTQAAQVRADARAAADREDQLGRGPADSWEDRSVPERCILGFNAGPPMTPGAYNNNVQLFQTPGHVVVLTEMVHDARIVPVDGRPHLPSGLRQWKGDSRGRWEGNTLVVDTTNFYRETSLRGSDANMHLIERFTRTGADTLLYEFTVEDPSSWTRRWTAQVPMRRSQEALYEYACHEGNSGMTGILAGARALEKAARAGSK
jgi:hypothetical protein